jgi:hypothetical protein
LALLSTRVLSSPQYLKFDATPQGIAFFARSNIARLFFPLFIVNHSLTQELNFLSFAFINPLFHGSDDALL